MLARWLPHLAVGAVTAWLWAGAATPAFGQNYTDYRYPPKIDYQTSKFWHYPYYYYPANYWPCMGPQWPEQPGSPPLPPPAYMAFPPFKEPNWRYEYWQPQRYYRGFHFLLDVF
jgi:hypothetical protein